MKVLLMNILGQLLINHHKKIFTTLRVCVFDPSLSFGIPNSNPLFWTCLRLWSRFDIIYKLHTAYFFNQPLSLPFLKGIMNSDEEQLGRHIQ